MLLAPTLSSHCFYAKGFPYSFLLLHMFPCVGTLISIEIRWTTKSMVIHANLNNENLKCLGILTKLDRSYSNFQVTSSTNILDQDL